MFVLGVIDRRKLCFSFISLPPIHCESVNFRKNESKKTRPKRNGPRLQLGKLVDLTWAPAVEVWGVCCLRALSYLNENQYYMCQRFTRKKWPETRQSEGERREWIEEWMEGWSHIWMWLQGWGPNWPLLRSALEVKHERCLMFKANPVGWLISKHVDFVIVWLHMSLEICAQVWVPVNKKRS